jgi:hypothetical protein
MNSTTNDLSLKLVYVAILAGLILAFTSPLPASARGSVSRAVSGASAR